MATTYYAANYYDPFPTIPGPSIMMAREFYFAVSVALVINDIIKLSPIVAFQPLIIDDYFIDLPDLDTGGTPALQLDLGDNTTDDLFVAATTKGQSAAKLTPAVDGASGALPREYTSSNDFALHVDTAPQTGATGVAIRGWLKFHGLSYVGSVL